MTDEMATEMAAEELMKLLRLVEEIVQHVKEEGEWSVSVRVAVSGPLATALEENGYEVSYPGDSSAEYETLHVERRK